MLFYRKKDDAITDFLLHDIEIINTKYTKHVTKHVSSSDNAKYLIGSTKTFKEVISASKLYENVKQILFFFFQMFCREY